MATYTSNYGLHQWAPEDHFLRTDFNEDLKKIDDQLGAIQTQFQEVDEEFPKHCQFVAGIFQGDGAQWKQIELGFRPRVVSIYTSGYSATCTDVYSGNYAELTDTGFRIAYIPVANANITGHYYYYHALW